MVGTTATIHGVVTSVAEDGTRRGRLGGASITVHRDELFFNTTSSSARGDKGDFRITDLPPGSYVVEFTDSVHRPTSELVTVVAGEVRNLGNVPMEFRGPPDFPNTGSLVVSVLNSQDEELPGATVTLFANDDDDRSDPLHQIVGAPTQSSFRFPVEIGTLDVGTYQVLVHLDERYNDVVRRVSIGLGESQLTVRLFRKGQVSGQVVSSQTGNPPLDRVHAADRSHSTAPVIRPAIRSGSRSVSALRIPKPGRSAGRRLPTRSCRATTGCVSSHRRPGSG